MARCRATIVVVMARMASMGSAFIFPTPQTSLSKGISSIGGVYRGSTTRVPTSRGDTSAVAPLNVGASSFSGITDAFAGHDPMAYFTAAGAVGAVGAAACAVWFGVSSGRLICIH